MVTSGWGLAHLLLLWNVGGDIRRRRRTGNPDSVRGSDTTRSKGKQMSYRGPPFCTTPERMGQPN